MSVIDVAMVFFGKQVLNKSLRSQEDCFFPHPQRDFLQDYASTEWILIKICWEDGELEPFLLQFPLKLGKQLFLTYMSP